MTCFSAPAIGRPIILTDPYLMHAASLRVLTGLSVGIDGDNRFDLKYLLVEFFSCHRSRDWGDKILHAYTYGCIRHRLDVNDDAIGSTSEYAP